MTDRSWAITVINNSDGPLQITLHVEIAQYKDGKWNRLPFTEKYWERHPTAAMWSEGCKAGSSMEQKFLLSLLDMIDSKLSPGKYRLEKEIMFDWYFAEFEVV